MHYGRITKAYPYELKIEIRLVPRGEFASLWIVAARPRLGDDIAARLVELWLPREDSSYSEDQRGTQLVCFPNSE